MVVVRNGCGHLGHKLVACSYMVSGKLKITLGMHMVKYGCDLLGPATLKSTYLMNKSMNWADFLHAEGDVIIFG